MERNVSTTKLRSSLYTAAPFATSGRYPEAINQPSIEEENKLLRKSFSRLVAAKGARNRCGFHSRTSHQRRLIIFDRLFRHIANRWRSLARIRGRNPKRTLDKAVGFVQQRVSHREFPSRQPTVCVRETIFLL